MWCSSPAKGPTTKAWRRDPGTWRKAAAASLGGAPSGGRAPESGCGGGFRLPVMCEVLGLF